MRDSEGFAGSIWRPTLACVASGSPSVTWQLAQIGPSTCPITCAVKNELSHDWGGLLGGVGSRRTSSSIPLYRLPAPERWATPRSTALPAILPFHFRWTPAL